MSEVVLPREQVYLPFETGPYRMSMALTTVPESAWFEFDARYTDEMAERRRLLASGISDVFGALPSSDAARAETLHERRGQPDDALPAVVRPRRRHAAQRS